MKKTLDVFAWISLVLNGLFILIMAFAGPAGFIGIVFFAPAFVFSLGYIVAEKKGMLTVTSLSESTKALNVEQTRANGNAENHAQHERSAESLQANAMLQQAKATSLQMLEQAEKRAAEIIEEAKKKG